MIKILFATDLHLRSIKPVSRLDFDFLDVQLKKLKFIAGLSKDADVTILGGDIFDRPDVPHYVLLRAIQAMRGFKAPPYTVIGNHEVFGYQGKSVDSSVMGVFLEVGAVKKLDYLKIGCLHIYGVHAYDTLVTQVGKDEDEMAMIVAHKMITDTALPNLECIRVDLMAPVTNADIILSGDIHIPHEKVVDGKIFLNPGAMSRLSIADRDRMPGVYMITIADNMKISYEFIGIPAKPNDEVFDLKAHEDKLEATEHSKDFAKTYATAIISVKAEAHKIGESLQRFMKERKAPAKVQAVVTAYHTSAEANLLANVKED